MLRMSIALGATLGLSLVLASSPVVAQVPDPVVAASAPTPGSGHNYIGLANETVNPADGSLTFDLPLPLPPGRGISLPFSIHYDSGLMYYLSPYNVVTSTFPALNWTVTPGSTAAPSSIPFLSFSAQIRSAQYIATGQGQTSTYEQCDWTTGFVFRGLDGVQYPLGQVGAQWSDEASAPGDPPDSNCPYNPPAAGTYHGILVTPGTQNPDQVYGQPSMTLTDPNGTTYSFAAMPIGQISSFAPFAAPDTLFPQTITDRNGNQMTLTILGQHETGYIDTLGRTVVSWTYSGSGETIAVSGFGDVSISSQTLTGKLTFPGNITSTSQTNGACVKNSPQPNATTYTQSSVIKLPDGETYTLDFDQSFGQINKISFPGGGYVSYTWGTNPSSSSGNASYSFTNDNVLYQEGCSYEFDTPAITDRYVSYDGVNEALHQHFSYSTTWNPQALETWVKTTTVTSTDMTTGQVSIAKYTYGPIQADIYNSSSWLSASLPVERSIQYEDGSGKVLETVNKTWGDVRHVIGEQTILSNGQGSAKQYCYDGNEQLTAVYEYGFQSEGSKTADPACYTNAFKYGSGEQGDPGLNNNAIGVLRRRTAIALHSFAGTHIVNEPDSVTVYDGSSPGVEQKGSSFVYDGGAIVNSAVATKTGLVTPPGLRGNATSVTQWSNNGASPVTSYTYYETGQMATKTDPCGNTTCSDMTGTAKTTYVYSDSPSGGNASGNSNAYLTQITLPNTGVAHVENYQYNYPSGKVTQSMDQNNIVTNYAYDDPLGRLTLIDSAPGTINWATNASAESKTAYSYPSATEVDIAQDQVTTGDGVLKSSTIVDSFGHRIEAVGRDGSVVETGYNGLGMVCAVSNTALAANLPASLSCTVGSNKAVAATDGYTYFTYDALGRKSVQTQPDSTTQKWQYNNSTTTSSVDFIDETTSHWQWDYDSLGRLTKTLENGPVTKTLSLETDYTYDLLDDLLSVNQKGASGDTARYRTFTYDSLSRLTNACNPETIKSGGVCTPTAGPWSAAYTYDANGNVSKRTDARGIATNYTYDAMNRVTAKSYTNDPANTPALSYGYDVEYPWQQVQDEDHAVGHLNWVMATVGTTNLTTWTSGDWDQRGNSIGYVNCLGSNAQSCPGAGVGANYGYNLNEDLTGISADAYITTYNGELDLTYGFDTAGRLNSIVTGARVGASNPTLTSTAFSGLTYYPGGAVETANLAIDPTTNVAGIALSRTYDNRGRITGEADTNSLKQSAYSYTVSYDGSGSVKSFNDSVAGAWTVSMDVLHRLAGLSGNVKGVPVSMQETYDSFGSRNVEYYTYNGTQTQPSPFLNFYTSNRASSFSYDYSGNQLSDGSNNYLYDAENRICAVQQLAPLSGTYGYVYAANGPLLGLGNLTSFTCDVTKNGLLTTNGLALTNAYMAGPQGERLIEVNGSNFNLLHYNVFWEGKLLGTFAGTTEVQTNWHFALNDWLGTKRVTTTSAGTNWTSTFSGPFGDYQSQTGTGSDPSEEHFTGKPRDTVSNLDYFGARYYNSNMGRWMSPDYQDPNDDVDTPLAVPNGALTNPQTLNLYSYVQNNPLSTRDYNGHASWQDCGDGSGYQCWTGDYNGEENNGLFWNSQSKQWQGGDPNPPPDSDPAGMFFTGLTRAMLGQNHGYSQMGRAFMLDGLSLGMKSVAALIPFGRPAFVPANWQQKELRNGDGVKYVDPNNPHNQVLLEKAKPGSSNPGQQVDYMKVLKDGQWLDANGNQVGNQTQDSHIPQGTELPPDTFGPIP